MGQEDRSAVTRDEVLVALFLGMEHRAQAELRIFQAVEDAVDAGLEWEDIGRALGMDPEDAYSWVSPIVDKMPEPPAAWFVPRSRRLTPAE